MCVNVLCKYMCQKVVQLSGLVVQLRGSLVHRNRSLVQLSVLVYSGLLVRWFTK